MGGDGGAMEGGASGTGGGSGTGGTGGSTTADGGLCPGDCNGSPADENSSPCVAGEDALWYCHGGSTADYEFISAHCESTGIATPQPGFCCSLDFLPECLNH
jgi:hypothetical protein